MWGPRDDQGAEFFNMAWKTDRSQLGVELAPGKSQEPKNNKKWKSREQEQKLVIGRSRPLLKQSKNRVHENQFASVSREWMMDGRGTRSIMIAPFSPATLIPIRTWHNGERWKRCRYGMKEGQSAIVERIGGLIINQFWFITRIQSCTTRGFPK